MLLKVGLNKPAMETVVAAWQPAAGGNAAGAGRDIQSTRLAQALESMNNGGGPWT